MDATQREFQRLTQLVLSDLATEGDREQLLRLSSENPQLISAVVDELTIDALLKWRSGRLADTLVVAGNGGVVTRSGVDNILSRRMPLYLSVLAASILLLAVGVGGWMAFAPVPLQAVVADIVRQDGVVWAKDTTALADGSVVRPGRLSSTGGEYTLQFRDGATVRIVGGASLDIKSHMLVHLEHGRATALVPPQSIGFTIQSALMDVIDQGTEFGIAVDGANTSVVVFDGEVDVKSNLKNAGPLQRLTQGNAIEVSREGGIGRLADIRRDSEGRWWSGSDPDAGEHVIARVTDNIGGSSQIYSCYHTTYQGLHDDVLAYSDNPHHQWNGLTAEGLPQFLRGADYVRTFNHYRYLEFFEMTVEFSTPAEVYVFADNRLPPPDWLVEQFEDTGVDIGLDEGPWLDDIPAEYRHLDRNTTSVGAGNSIDNVFSVWHRRCVDGKPIKLGSAGVVTGKEGQGRSMYGVAATPLNDEVEATPNGTPGT